MKGHESSQRMIYMQCCSRDFGLLREIKMRLGIPTCEHPTVSSNCRFRRTYDILYALKKIPFHHHILCKCVFCSGTFFTSTDNLLFCAPKRSRWQRTKNEQKRLPEEFVKISVLHVFKDHQWSIVDRYPVEGYDLFVAQSVEQFRFSLEISQNLVVIAPGRHPGLLLLLRAIPTSSVAVINVFQRFNGDRCDVIGPVKLVAHAEKNRSEFALAELPNQPKPRSGDVLYTSCISKRINFSVCQWLI